MRKSILNCFLLLLLLSSCSEAIYEAELQQAETRSIKAKSEPYSFSKITEPSNWKRLTSIQEMLTALQLPEEVLLSISTGDLVSTCLNYPLYLNYTAYNNELIGIKNVLAGFNGFDALKEREDAAENVIAAYAQLDIKSTMQNNEISVPELLKTDYMELILASEFIPSVFEKENVAKLLEAFNKHYKDKADNQEITGYYSLKKSLLLGCVIVKKMSETLTDDELQILNQYVQNGGEVDNKEEVEEVINILYKQ